MNDVAQGRSTSQTVNSLISECVWGTIDPSKPRSERAVDDWVMCQSLPTVEPPAPNALTFGSFLEFHSDIPKGQQRELKRTFTDAGGVGEACRPAFESVCAALQLSNDDRNRVLEAQASGCHAGYLSEGNVHMLPSFFAAVDFLCDANVDFRLLFRTYGVDLGNVCTEFNLFCEGKHPIFRPKRLLDGSDAAYPHDLRIKMPQRTGKMIRVGPGKEGICMAHLITSDCNTEVCTNNLHVQHDAVRVNCATHT